jgi:hypothetical protein
VGQKKMTITKRALLQRINRQLNKDLEQVKAYRNRDDFYHIDLKRKAIIAEHVDIEDLGREMKVLQPWEALESEK